MGARALIEVLAEIEDFRQEQGKRHSLAAIMAMAVAAIICGYRTYGAIAQWGRNYDRQLIAALGFKHEQTPCASTLHTIFSKLDKEMFEAKLTDWAQSVMAATPMASGQLEALAADGKTLRGSRKQGAVGVHLLSLFSHRLGLTLAQQAVPDKTNEIPILPAMLKNLILTGRVITMDALNTQRETAQTILDQGGDYLMIVKENQADLLEQIQTVFEQPAPSPMAVVEQFDLGHARVESRRLTASTILSGYCDWPGTAQVFEIHRTTILKNTGLYREERVYGITSLAPQHASAQALLHLVRGQWAIENKSHYVRDVTFDEDRSQVRSGNIPQIMAALRNTAIGLIHLAGFSAIAASCRRFAAQPWLALALLGIQRTE